MAEANHSLHHAYLRARMGVAVMTLARQRVIARVKEQLRATGLKVAHFRHREIVVAAEEYLAEYPELIAEAKPIVLRWFAKGVFGKRAARCAETKTDAQRTKAFGVSGLAVQMSRTKWKR